MKSLRILILFLFVQILLLGCGKSNKQISENNKNDMEVINVKFEDPKPKYFGLTGLHLYSVKPINNSEIVVKTDANAISHYKVYWDLAIFLSNSLNPNVQKTRVETFSIFGNSIHNEKLQCDIEDDGLQIVGYLDKEDIQKLSKFLVDKSLDKMEGIKKYYQNLKPEVKIELEILLDKELFPTLNDYMAQICDFVSNCVQEESNILLINNP